MAEQPVFTTRAHVFQIDPVTKQKWKPCSSSAVPVSFYHDATKNTFRIISVDGTKALINSPLSTGMTFTKTSAKFGQWTDPRASTVYGLGFQSESDLSSFAEKFKEASAKLADVTPTRQPPKTAPKPGPSESTSSISSDNTGSNSDVTALKYENERLKTALSTSSTNAKKWEAELQALKTNNARLTTALQESVSNVEEWKVQLATWKDESSKWKRRCQELEAAKGADEQQQQSLASVQADLAAAKQAQADAEQKLKLKESENSRNEGKISDLEGQLKRVEASLKQREQSESKYHRLVKDMTAWQSTLAAKISDLDDLHTAFGSLMKD